MEGSGASANQVPCRLLGDDDVLVDAEIMVVADRDVVQIGDRIFFSREDLLLALGVPPDASG